jgi:hypothetical protein
LIGKGLDHLYQFRRHALANQAANDGAGHVATANESDGF